MCQVEYDGRQVVARGTNKASQVALRGQQHAEGDLVVPVGQVASVELREATRLVNGRVTVRTREGAKYLLHFRRKHAEGFRQLAEQLRRDTAA